MPEPVVVDGDYRAGYVIALSQSPGGFKYDIWCPGQNPASTVQISREAASSLWGARYVIRRDIRRRKRLARLNRKYAR